MQLLANGPVDGAGLLLAHGAGATMDSRWMDDMSARLAARGIRVLRFEFAYMAARRTGSRPSAPRADRVLGEYRNAWREAGQPPLIGGKSYGGRVASLVADELHGEGAVGVRGAPPPRTSTPSPTRSRGATRRGASSSGGGPRCGRTGCR